MAEQLASSGVGGRTAYGRRSPVRAAAQRLTSRRPAPCRCRSRPHHHGISAFRRPASGCARLRALRRLPPASRISVRIPPSRRPPACGAPFVPLPRLIRHPSTPRSPETTSPSSTTVSRRVRVAAPAPPSPGGTTTTMPIPHIPDEPRAHHPRALRRRRSAAKTAGRGQAPPRSGHGRPRRTLTVAGYAAAVMCARA